MGLFDLTDITLLTSPLSLQTARQTVVEMGALVEIDSSALRDDIEAGESLGPLSEGSRLVSELTEVTSAQQELRATYIPTLQSLWNEFLRAYDQQVAAIKAELNAKPQAYFQTISAHVEDVLLKPQKNTLLAALAKIKSHKDSEEINTLVAALESFRKFLQDNYKVSAIDSCTTNGNLQSELTPKLEALQAHARNQE